MRIHRSFGTSNTHNLINLCCTIHSGKQMLHLLIFLIVYEKAKQIMISIIIFQIVGPLVFLDKM